MQKTSMEPKTFSAEIIDELEARGSVPKSRWYFLASRGVVWALAIFSTLVGAASFAIAEFVFLDNDGITKLQGSSIQDIAETIPFFWLGLVALFAASAYFGFRRTRKGYKYATVTVVSAVIFLSVVLGLLLNQYDFGQQARAFMQGITLSQTEQAD